jgi:hypothetical protein
MKVLKFRTIDEKWIIRFTSKLQGKMFSMSRSTKKFPQLKMPDNCVKSYSS